MGSSPEEVLVDRGVDRVVAKCATLVEVLRLRAEAHGARPAFVFLLDGEVEAARLSYAELDAAARGIAATLARELEEGERALLLYPPGLEFVTAFLGCLYAGVVAVPAYPPRPGGRAQPRLQAIAADARPRVVLTTAAARAGVRALCSGVAGLEAALWRATDAAGGVVAAADRRQPAPESLAFLQYTSGSTSTPKGVRVGHAQLLANERMIRAAFDQDEASVVVGWLPLYHDMGLIGNVLQPLYAGGRCVLMSPVAFLQRPRRWLEAISRYRGTTSGGPNFAYELCVRKVGEEDRQGLDLSSWRVAFDGAEPVRAESLERFAAAFAGCGFRRRALYPCYGLAEATLFVSGPRPGEGPAVAWLGAEALAADRVEEVAAGAAGGRALVGCGGGWGGERLAIVRPEREGPPAADGARCDEAEVGEIWVAGPNLAGGYWGREEESERTFGARLAGSAERWLRTGDLGFLRQGELFVTGRLKDLVILRGRNHYPQDLERTAEESHGELRAGGAAAFALETEGEERLVLALEAEHRRRSGVEEIAAAVRRAVAAEHEVAVWEVVLLKPGGLPKTSSGKVQRAACRAAYLAGTLAELGRSALPEAARSALAAAEPAEAVGAELLPPGREELLSLDPEARREALLRWVGGRAAALLGGARPGPEEALTALGLDSLAAVELKAEVEAALAVEVPLAQLLTGMGTGALARHLADNLPGRGAVGGEGSAGAAAIHDQERLSAGQEALWFLERLAPEGAAYNVPVAVRVEGGLDGAPLAAALARLTARHAALRTRFTALDGAPAARVAGSTAVDLVTEAAAGWSASELAARLAEEAWRPFDLGRAPLLRLRLYDRGPAGSVLLLVMHHIVSDFWSLAVLGQELAALYAEARGGERAALPPLASGYGDWVRRQEERLAGGEGERLWSYWRERLSGPAGPPPDLDLPLDRPRPAVQTQRGGARGLRLPAELSDELSALARARGATLFSTLLAAWQTLLARLSGQEDFAVGAPTVGRERREEAGVVGYFVGPVALRSELAGDPGFGELVERVQAGVAGALAHAAYPFVRLAERLAPQRDAARPPLFQVAFVLQTERPGEEAGLAALALGEDGARVRLGGLALESLAIGERRAQFELTLRLAEVEGRLAASLEFNADLFDATTAQRLLGQWSVLLAAAVSRPRRPVSQLPLLSPAERQQAVVEWGAGGLPGSPAAELLHQRVLARAAAAPDAVAVAAEAEAWSYGEVAERAGRLARRLRQLGVGPEARVAVLLERSAELVTAALAVLSAGGAYLPLDPSYPAERLAAMVEEASVPVVLTRHGLAPPPARSPALRLDRLEDLGAAAAGPPPAAAAPENVAYVIYTSGSTGRPKGIEVSHRAAAHFATWHRERFAWGPESRGGLVAGPSFDASVSEIWPCLAAGGTLVVPDEATRATPSRLVEWLAAERVTHCFLPTPLAEGVLAEEWPRPTALAWLLTGGDRLHRGPLPGARFRLANQYGPAENTVVTTEIEVAAGEVSPPIGRALPEVGAYVTDRGLQPLPIGAPGELTAGGAQVARGYLGRPGLTAASFVPDPFSGASGARLYRSGDLVRLRRDGRLEWLARIDRQVKVRGVRVELAEVEAALGAHPAVVEAAVVMASGTTGPRLAAFVVGRRPLVASELRQHLLGRLPEAMVPAQWSLLPALPLTPNHKVDRRALAALATRQAIERAAGEGSEKAAPRTPAEELVAGIFAELLEVERVGRDDDFFALGGHSLLATRAMSRLARAFGGDPPLAALFEAPTVAALAARLSGAAAPAGPGIPAAPLAASAAGLAAPASFAQSRLWFLDQLEPGSAAYNVPGEVALAGPLAVAALAGALGEIARRHETLRTTLRLTADGRLEQVVAPAASGPAALPLVDLSLLPPAARAAAAERLAAGEAARPFDLARGPLCRLSLLRLAGREHRLLLVLHHAVADGGSLTVLLDELAALYAAFAEGRPSPLPPLPVCYADFAHWQRRWLAEGELDRELAYWRSRLAGLSPLELPADRPRPPVHEGRGALCRGVVSGEVAGAVERLARRSGATLFMTLLTAFATLLGRWTGEERVAVGSPVANRRRPELEGLIGLFVNTLVLDASLAGDPELAALLLEVRAACLGAYAHQDVPFERLVEELAPHRDLGRNPLFSVMLVLEQPLAPRRAGALELTPRRLSSGTSKLDLTLALAPAADGRLDLVAEHDVALFEAATIDRLLAHFNTLLAAAAAAPATRLSALPMLTPAESAQLLGEWADGGPPARWPPRLPAPPAGSPPPALLHELFLTRAAAIPEAVALVAGEERLSYGELALRVERLAAHLTERLAALEAGPEARVGVCLERDARLVVALLAVLAAGGAYVPLDPAYPAARLAYTLEDSGAAVLVTVPHLLDVLPRPAAGALVLLDGDGRPQTPPGEAASPARPSRPTISPQSLAYLIYTSGSTGRPKGVAIEHASAVAFLAWAAERFAPRELAGVLAATSVCFDLSVFELFLPLATGGKVILAADALALPELPAALEVTLVNTVPSAMAELVRGAGLPRSVATINLAGEPLRAELARQIFAAGPPCRLCDLYGPSEDTTYSTWSEVRPDDAGEPTIGRPIAGTRAYVVDRRLAPVPAGVAGELVLGGAGLARGYLGRPGLTAERFAPDPFGPAGGRLYRTGDLARWRAPGRLDFLGRADHQVKVRGFRIEPGEVEVALGEHPEVGEAVVVARGEAEGGTALVAYVAGRDGRPVPAAAELRAFLSRRLPAHMVPSLWVALAALPRTPNGKVDRSALPAPAPDASGEAAGRSAAFVAPCGPLEEIVAGVWREVLGRERVGAEESFFDLGGHSLLAARVVARLRAVLGVELPLAALFRSPTVSGLAREVAGARDGAAAPPLGPVPRPGAPPLSFAQERLWFFDQLSPGSPAYHMAAAVRLTGALDVAALGRSLGEVVRRHEVLRTLYPALTAQDDPSGGERPVQRIEPPAAGCFLPVVDLGGLAAAARAAAAAVLARAAARRAFDLSAAAPLRLALLRLVTGEHLLLLVVHHIAADGWSLGVLTREIGALYPAFRQGLPSPLPELALQYADFALWQRRVLDGERLARELAVWRQRLEGAPRVLELPTDRPRPRVESLRGAQLRFLLPAEVGGGVAALGRREAATPFMVLLAAFAALLGRWSGQRELLIGLPVAGRVRLETEPLIGLFVNTVALRADLGGEPSGRELVARVRAAVLDGDAHQELPFERLVEALGAAELERSAARAPLVQVLFSSQRELALDLPGLGVAIEELDTGTARLDLAVSLAERADGLAGTIEYATDLFDRTTIARLTAHLVRLAGELTRLPEARISTLAMLSAAERHQVAVEWGEGPVSPPAPASVVELFRARAAAAPEAVALVAAGRAVGFAELDRRSRRVAQRLLARRVGVGEVVALAAGRTVEMVAGLLGIWRSGAAFLPLDPAAPAERMAFLLADSGAGLVLAEEAVASRLPARGPEVLDLAAAQAGGALAAGPGVRPRPGDLAYLIYTSGTTGVPKAVAVTHGSLAHTLTGAIRAFGFAAGDRMPVVAPFSFDIFLFELLAPMLAGGTAGLVGLAPTLDLDRLLAELETATRFHAVPAVMQQVEELAAARPAGDAIGERLDELYVGGDAVPPELLGALRRRFPRARLRVLYGPTEATILCAAADATAADGAPRPRLGRPLAGVRLELRDAAGRVVPPGLTGEVWIGGPGVALGYLHRPAANAERFVPEPGGAAGGGRLYRSGDLARWSARGELEFLGRADGQVKVRGFRIEPGEVESRLASHPEVERAAVVVAGAGPGEHRLVAFYVAAPGAEPAEAALRAHLERALPEYMVPTALHAVAALPLTAHGKVDRQALAARAVAAAGAIERAPYVAPRSALEERIAGIWSELLGAGRIGVEESFFELGGHSLLATRMVSRVRRKIGVEVSLAAFFAAPTVAGLARAIGAAGGAAVLAAPAPRPRGAVTPLSFAQERLWFLDQLEPGSAQYNLPAALLCRGRLEPAVLARALAAVVARHEALRTRFRAAGGRAEQVIDPPAPLALPQVDLSRLPPAARRELAGRLAAAEAARPFDLAAGPLLRVALLALAPGERVLLATLHHIVSDGWSMGVLVGELGALYPAFAAGRPSPLPPLPLQYADYALWQREQLRAEVVAAEVEWWRRELAGAPAVLELPADRPRPAVATSAGGWLPLALAPDLVAALARIARQRRATRFMALCAGFTALLARLGGGGEVVIGSPVANRTRIETEGMIGFFANTLVLRGEVAGDPSFGELVERLRRRVLAASAHQDLPFEKLVEALAPERDLAHTPLFQVMLAVFDEAPRLTLPGVGVELLASTERAAKLDLTLELAGGQGGLAAGSGGIAAGSSGLAGGFEYRRDLFDATTVARWAAHLQSLLAAAAASPELEISTLPLLAAAERQQLVVEWNDTAEGGETEAVRLDRRFVAQAERVPEAVALVWREERWSYAALARRAAALAARLAALGVGPEARVGVCLERTPRLVAALLGVLESGAAYLPIDPAYPAERVAFLLEDAQAGSGPALLVSEQRVLARLPEGGWAGARVVRMEELEAAPAEAAPPVPRRPVEPSAANLAYVIYTSGSTGRPKGVGITHGGAATLVAWARRRWGAEELSGVLASTSVCFDLSVFELFTPLSWGGTVVLADSALALAEPGAVSGRVRLVNTVPSVMTELLRLGAVPGSVSTVNLAGEALPAALVARLLEQPGIERVVNLYGPSEDTTYSTVAVLARGEIGPPPIGVPIAETEAHVVDRALRLAPPGVPGELCLAGRGLARGYLGRPALTAERFVPDPFGRRAGGRVYRTGDLVRRRADGRLDYLGRLDHQVKLRGFRVELGEVEAALEALPEVEEAVALVAGTGAGARLVAFVVPRPGAAPDPAALAARLGRRLPAYMVPEAVEALAALPRTPNGKADRRALAALAVNRAADRVATLGRPAAGAGGRAPRTPAEEVVAGIWAEVLGVERVGAEESFFALGGHSLLATQVVARLRAAFGVELPLRRLFETPTVAALAAEAEALAAGGAAAEAPPLVPQPRGAGLPLSFAQQRLWLLDRLGAGAAYNLPAPMRLAGRLDAGALAAAFTGVVRRHEALRTRFPESAGRPAQVIEAAARVALPVIDLSALAPPAGGIEAMGLARSEALRLARSEALRLARSEALRLARSEALRPFDLAAGPLLRAALLRLEREEHLLCCTLHHIVSDLWSMGVLVREVAALYGEAIGGPAAALAPMPIQYADYALWQRRWLAAGELDRQLAWWRERLAGAPAALDLPLDRPRPPRQSFRGGVVRFAVDAATAGRLAALARAAGATRFMLLLAAFDLFLHRHGGQEDLSVGTPVAGRTRLETEGLIGFFVNTLVLRADLAGDPPFGELVERVRRVSLDAWARQDLPFERLVDELRLARDLSRSPLFQVFFSLQTAPAAGPALPGVALSPVELGGTIAKFDLTLTLGEAGEGLAGVLEHNADLFDTTTVERFAARFAVLLGEVAADPGRRLSELPLLAAGERQQLLVEWSGGAARPRRAADREPPGLRGWAHERLAAWAARAPQTPAVVADGVTTSYAELDRAANRLAHHLRRLGVGPEERVALLLERSLDVVVAIFGVLKAGGAYVPIDPAHPAERLAFTLADSGARVVLTWERFLPRLPAGLPFGASAAVVALDRDAGRIAAEPAVPPAVAVEADTPAYVIYTSGSTGRPKGVVVPHRGLAAYSAASAGEHGVGPGDRFLQFSSISFDASVEEIFDALGAGAALVVRGERREGVSELLARWREQGLTVLFLPTAFWHQLAAAMEAEGLALPPSVRLVKIGGEKALGDRFVAWWRSLPPGLAFVNAYGPTETTVAATRFLVPGELPVDERLADLPIGRPYPHARVWVVDRRLEPVPAGVAGELVIGGESLARGYLGRPGLTAERFVPDPFAPLSGAAGGRLYRTGDLVRFRAGGLLDYLGRTDAQVKVRGFRIEPGEIEAALAAHPAVAEAAVVASGGAAETSGAGGERRLLAYFVPASGPAPRGRDLARELAAFLAARLPAYMVPSAFVALPALPLNAHGKVDRRALPALAAPAHPAGGAAAGPRPPGNPLEGTIAAIWGELLGVPRVGMEDNFFESGGSSLSLVELHSRLQQALGRELRLVELFEHPTVRSLAARLAGDPADARSERRAAPAVDAAMGEARGRSQTRRESMRQLAEQRRQRHDERPRGKALP